MPTRRSVSPWRSLGKRPSRPHRAVVIISVGFRNWPVSLVLDSRLRIMPGRFSVPPPHPPQPLDWNHAVQRVDISAVVSQRTGPSSSSNAFRGKDALGRSKVSETVRGHRSPTHHGFGVVLVVSQQHRPGSARSGGARVVPAAPHDAASESW